MFARSLVAIIVALVFVSLGIQPVLAVDPDFNVAHRFGARTDSTFSVAVGDMDGDGDLDIVGGHYQQQSAVYLNDGAGSFTTARNFGTGADYTRSVAVGDMDGDGDLDIVAGN